MRRFRTLLGLLFGFALGVFFSQIFLSKQAEPISISKSSPTTEAFPTAQETKSEEKTEPTLLQKETMIAAAPSCPACPCLYSDQILDPPRFDSNLPETIETNREGEALVQWNEVAGAKKYLVHIENKEGKIIKTYKASRRTLYLKDIPLPEGFQQADYFLRISSVNGKDEEGPKGPRKNLHVAPQANVVAPVIQEIKVED
jgi:hypothetical protein